MRRHPPDAAIPHPAAVTPPGARAVMLASLGVVVFRTDAAHALTSLEGVWERLAGVEAAACLGRPLLGFVAADDRAAAGAALAAIGENAAAFEMRIGGPAGRRTSVEVRARRVGAGLEGVLIERLARADEARKVESPGGPAMDVVARLAGGIAHDFNNLLFVINNYATMLADALDPADPHRSDVLEIAAAGARAAALTRRLLDFGRGTTRARPVDLNDAVAGFRPLLERLVPRGVALALDLPSDLERVDAAPDRVERVVTELVVNARDALAEGGRVTISARNGAFAATPGGGAPRGYVAIAVSDDGPGMPAEVAERAFEPYFTTKTGGDGRGLGLATVHGIAAASGGWVELTSRPGRGTTVTVYLPAAPERPAVDDAPARPERSATILVCDDEAQIRSLIEYVLRGRGHDVLGATSGADALAVAAATAGPIDLVITDLLMPGMSGKDLAGALRDVRPATPVIFISGYPDPFAADGALLEGANRFLQKPFSPPELLAMVDEALTPR